ncbi:S53 family peptidase [Dyella sp.]|uniref:S53 family peptidase n=1 Tax=Dyella sp. TaxID=1869338 RepID=UPI002ED1F4DD
MTHPGFMTLCKLARKPLTATLAWGLAMQCLPAAAATQVADTTTWTATRTHAFASSDASFNGYAADQEPVSITIALKLRNQDVLDSFTHELFRPGSLSYHQFMNTEQSTAAFAPTQQQAQAIADYLTQQGFTHVQIAANRLLVTGDGTVGASRRAFRTEIGHFTRNGHDGIANTLDVQMPAALSGSVDRVLGLQTLDRAQTLSWHGKMQPVPVSPATPHANYHIVTSPDGNPNAHGYYPQEFATVYHAGSAPAATNTTAAIIGFGSMTNAVNDLVQMENGQGLSITPTQVVTIGGASSDDGGQGEWGMDAQAMVGISGGLKQLTFYAVGGNESQSLALQTINRVVSDNTARVINMSWSWPACEDSTAGWADSAFQLGVAQGQTFSAASGDNGALPCNVSGGNGSYGSTRGVEYPASSPYVVAVGGTTLSTTTADAYQSEASWPYSGGGISAREAKPSWQSALTGSFRQLPDVAFDADWTNSPIVVYFTASASGGIPASGYYTNGGTSLASPLFVGAWARLETAYNNALGFAAPSLYGYAGTFPFHDVVSGNNGYYAATAGRDNATGWGSFDIQAANSFIAANPGFISGTTGPGASHAGMTWTSRASVVHVGIDSASNPYTGDTAVTTALPVLCFNPANLPAPAGINFDFSDGWAAGTVGVTSPVAGTQLTSRAVADGLCASAHGSGWRMAEFHDGNGGWTIWAAGSIPAGNARFWTAINDQPANPWDTTSGKALTWTPIAPPSGSLVHVGNDSITNAYTGDTPATSVLPVLCIHITNAAAPSGITYDYYDGWAPGNVAFTSPVAGTTLTSRAVADSVCSTAYGSGWRMAEFHDGNGGWSFWSAGLTTAVNTRFWVAINDQPANPWN